MRKPANRPLPLRPTKMEVVFKCYTFAHAQEAYRTAVKHPEWNTTLVIMPYHTENIDGLVWYPAVNLKRE